MIEVKCRCGHKADLNEFCRTKVYGELPPGHFQCPACGVAWCRKESDHRILRAGAEVVVIPGRVQVLPVEARL